LTASAGLTIGFEGGSISGTILGGAVSPTDIGGEAGIDVGFGATAGASVLWNSKITTCGCNK
jgi:hypothetical protein